MARNSSSRHADRPDSMRSEVAEAESSSGNCSRVWFTLIPMPTTMTGSSPDTTRDSARMPATLRPPMSRSLGHLIFTYSPAAASRTRAAAAAAHNVSGGVRAADSRGRSRTEAQIPHPGGENHP